MLMSVAANSYLISAMWCSGLQPSLPTRPTLGHPLFHYMVTGPHAIALFEYKSAQVDELSFKVCNGCFSLGYLDIWVPVYAYTVSLENAVIEATVLI